MSAACPDSLMCWNNFDREGKSFPHTLQDVSDVLLEALPAATFTCFCTCTSRSLRSSRLLSPALRLPAAIAARTAAAAAAAARLSSFSFLFGGRGCCVRECTFGGPPPTFVDSSPSLSPRDPLPTDIELIFIILASMSSYVPSSSSSVLSSSSLHDGERLASSTFASTPRVCTSTLKFYPSIFRQC